MGGPIKFGALLAPPVRCLSRFWRYWLYATGFRYGFPTAGSVLGGASLCDSPELCDGSCSMVLLGGNGSMFPCCAPSFAKTLLSSDIRTTSPGANREGVSESVAISLIAFGRAISSSVGNQSSKLSATEPCLNTQMRIPPLRLSFIIARATSGSRAPGVWIIFLGR